MGCLSPGISILTVPVGTVIHQATFRVVWMSSWPRVDLLAASYLGQADLRWVLLN